MKTTKLQRWTGVVLSVAFLWWGYRAWREYENGYPNSVHILTKSEAVALQRESAKVSWAAAITNDVVGYHRTITTSQFIFGDDYRAWTASATVEFVNARGGVQRTNLYWLFKPTGRDAYCYLVTANECFNAPSWKP